MQMLEKPIHFRWIYAVLSRIVLCRELRVFCAIFLAQICVRAIFLRFSISEWSSIRNCWTLLIAFFPYLAEMEKNKNIAQTQIFDKVGSKLIRDGKA